MNILLPLFISLYIFGPSNFISLYFVACRYIFYCQSRLRFFCRSDLFFFVSTPDYYFSSITDSGQPTANKINALKAKTGSNLYNYISILSNGLEKPPDRTGPPATTSQPLNIC